MRLLSICCSNEKWDSDMVPPLTSNIFYPLRHKSFYRHLTQDKDEFRIKKTICSGTLVFSRKWSQDQGPAKMAAAKDWVWANPAKTSAGIHPGTGSPIDHNIRPRPGQNNQNFLLPSEWPGWLLFWSCLLQNAGPLFCLKTELLAFSRLWLPVDTFSNAADFFSYQI